MGSLRARPGRALVFALVLGLALAAGPLLLVAQPAEAATAFVVTTTGDNPDADLGDDRCDTTLSSTTAPCSLRAAIEEANVTPGPDTIAFNIPGGGLKTIRPRSELPEIVTNVAVDGYTQPGSKPNTAATGTNAVLTIELDGSNAGGSADGLRIAGSKTVVRGVVINGFDGEGIVVAGDVTGVRIAGCFLGTDAAGTAALGNHIGVYLPGAVAAQIGGSGPAARNLISGNRDDGVEIFSRSVGTRILGNLIGTTRTGGGNLGNGEYGVDAGASSVIVGGDAAGQPNVIAFNGVDGVAVDDRDTGVRVLRNAVFANAEQGIDLDRDGVTANDALDADEGANTRQNFPVITTATTTSVTGTLHSTPDQDFVLRLFSNPGNGDEGRFFHAAPLVVTTDGAGNASFAFANITPPIPAGRSVTATATNNGGSTSEFSFPAVPVAAGPSA